MPTVTVSSGNSPYHVTAGQIDTNDVVISGGSMFVDSGGTAFGTSVSSGGFLTVSAGGTESGSQILFGGSDTVFGTDLGATVTGNSMGVVGVINISSGARRTTRMSSTAARSSSSPAGRPSPIRSAVPASP